MVFAAASTLKGLGSASSFKEIMDFSDFGGGLGVSEPPNIGFERKEPGFSVSGFHSDNPEILSRFHQQRKKLGPKMSTPDTKGR